MKKALLTFSVTAAVSAPAVLYAVPYGYCFNDGIFFRGGMFMWILTVLAIAAVIVFFTAYYRKPKGSGLPFQAGSNDEPLSILKKRLANGDITEQEYDRLSSKLS